MRTTLGIITLACILPAAAFAQTDDVEVQKQAVFALAQMSDAASITRLTELARTHPRPEVRKQAIFWLGQKGGDDVQAFFEDVLTSDGDVEEQKQVLFALSQLPNRAGVSSLIKAAQEHPRMEIRKQAIFWLGQTDDDRAREALLSIIEAQN